MFKYRQNYRDWYNKTQHIHPIASIITKKLVLFHQYSSQPLTSLI